MGVRLTFEEKKEYFLRNSKKDIKTNILNLILKFLKLVRLKVMMNSFLLIMNAKI